MPASMMSSSGPEYAVEIQEKEPRWINDMGIIKETSFRSVDLLLAHLNRWFAYPNVLERYSPPIPASLHKEWHLLLRRGNQPLHLLQTRFESPKRPSEVYCRRRGKNACTGLGQVRHTWIQFDTHSARTTHTISSGLPITKKVTNTAKIACTESEMGTRYGFVC